MRAKRIFSVFAAGVLLTGQLVMPVSAKSSSELQQELDEYEEQLSDSESRSKELTEQITDLQKEVGTLTSDLESLNIQMEEYREGMTLRIKYFYEDQPVNSILDVLTGAESFSEMISRLEYLQSLYEYDADQLDRYEALIGQSNEKKEELNENIEEISALLAEQETLQAELGTAISGKESELAQAEAAEAEAAAKEARERAEAEAAAREAEEKKADTKDETEELTEAAKATVSSISASDDSSDSSESSASGNSSKDSSSGNSSKDSSSGSSSKGSSSGSNSKSSSGLVSYNGNVATVSMYPNDSGGVLTRSKGVVYYNGHKETWYSQRILPGGGLNIPGRHVDENGLIRDGDGYICVASSDLPKGTLIETSLGMGKVYDSGCASGTIDIYTDW